MRNALKNKEIFLQLCSDVAINCWVFISYFKKCVFVWLQMFFSRNKCWIIILKKHSLLALWKFYSGITITFIVRLAILNKSAERNTQWRQQIWTEHEENVTKKMLQKDKTVSENIQQLQCYFFCNLFSCCRFSDGHILFFTPSFTTAMHEAEAPLRITHFDTSRSGVKPPMLWLGDKSLCQLSRMPH